MFRALALRIPKSICAVKSETALANIGSMRKISSDSESEPRATLENVDVLKCLNKVTLLGRVASPLTVINRANNSDIVAFTLATNDIRRSKATNEIIKRSDFHRVKIYLPKLANKAKDVIAKGSRLMIEGRIQYDVREGETGKINFTNIVADNIVFLTGNRVRNSQNSEAFEADDVDLEAEEVKQ